MDLFTIQVAHWRLARNRDIVYMDTTVRSGNSLFAPTWDMVLGYKAWLKAQETGQPPEGRHPPVDEETYRKLYWERMNQSWRERRDEWMTVLEMKEPLAIACYCTPGTFCHRHLLKDIFEKLCAKYGIPFLYYGELK